MAKVDYKSKPNHIKFIIKKLLVYNISLYMYQYSTFFCHTTGNTKAGRQLIGRFPARDNVTEVGTKETCQNQMKYRNKLQRSKLFFRHIFDS